MTLRRGFKTEANWYAREMRSELGLAADSPICPWALSKHLGFPVIPLSAYSEVEPEAVSYFKSAGGTQEFSAVTIFAGYKRWIVHNDAHHPNRQAANIAHEIAHGLLLHPPKPPFDENGSRHYDAAREAEANWLGPALLISDEAAVSIVQRKLALSLASRRYGASADVIRMRINVSGAYVRVARSA